MREMKDSGIEWIGAIPATFTPTKIKYLVEITDGTHDTPRYVDPDDNTYPLVTSRCIIDGKLHLELANHISAQDYYEIKKRSCVRKFDVIMPMIGTVGNPSIIMDNSKFAIKNVAVIKANGDYNLGKLILYMINSSIIKSQFDLLNTAGVQSFISQEKIKNLTTILPDNIESIVQYLDQITETINGIMSDIQHQIELLQEYKQSVITEAVTKGLDKNVAMKDSNEFIGKIPQSWSICKVKHVSDFVTDGAHISPDTSEEEYLFLSVTDMDDYGNLNFDNCLRITTAQYNYLVRTGCKPQKNDVIISKDGTIGKTTIIETDKDFVVASSLVIIHPSKNKIIAKYLRYSLMSKFVQEQLQMLLAGSALKRVSVGKNANLKIVYTSNINEQEDIIDYLDKKCAEIDAILADKQKQLDTLTEYKKSLIYEYVTGKKEVPANA